MRHFLFMLLLPVLSLPVLSLPVFIPPAWAADPPAPDAAVVHHARQSWEQRFTQANTAHDGHLTLAEAKAGYPLVAKHFDDIDADHKGYVSQNDIRAWRVMRKAAHRLTKPYPDKLAPRAAFHLGCPDLRAVSASASQRIDLLGDPPPIED